MQAYIDQLIRDGAFAGVPKEVVYAIGMVLVAFIVLSIFVAPLAGVTSWLERRDKDGKHDKGDQHHADGINDFFRHTGEGAVSDQLVNVSLHGLLAI